MLPIDTAALAALSKVADAAKKELPEGSFAGTATVKFGFTAQKGADGTQTRKNVPSLPLHEILFALAKKVGNSAVMAACEEVLAVARKTDADKPLEIEGTQELTRFLENAGFRRFTRWKPTETTITTSGKTKVEAEVLDVVVVRATETQAVGA